MVSVSKVKNSVCDIQNLCDQIDENSLIFTE